MTPIEEQTILLTGTTSGLGRELAKALASRGATVLLHGRDERAGKEIMTEIKHQTGNDKLRFYKADLASLREAMALARQITGECQRLDTLVNNAAAGFGRDVSKREESHDGYELRFAVNYLAPYVLTENLLPLLTASAPARIVNVASVGQAPLDFGDLMLTRDYSGVTAYRKSKVAMIAWTFDLAERLSESGVTVNALHPASLMPTKMVLEAGWNVMSSVEEGVAATLRLIVAPELDGVTGEFFDGLRPAKAIPQAYDKKMREELARVTGELVSRVLS
ncbi:MAG: SDR family NAD(P)-dependent oxidoreductase [Verrucomicrobia bacterium]|nr:SDR family NAD(P)-dependent oxidoreductase [Verrucomicrobiota bacterium]